MNTVRVLFFAAAREACGLAQGSFELPKNANVSELIALVVKRHPGLEALLPHLRVAVNQEFAEPHSLLPENAEVALIPPVAGGNGRFSLSSQPLEISQVVERVASVSRGGVVTFIGNVRNQNHGKTVLRLEYEAYAPMALRKMAELADETESKWPGTVLAIAHRIGVLLPSESAVIMAAAAPHRKEAFVACEYAMTRLKADVPIWKKEFYEDGHVWVGLRP